MNGRKNVLSLVLLVVEAVIVTGCGDVRSGQQAPGTEGLPGTVNTEVSESTAADPAASQQESGVTEPASEPPESGEARPPESETEQSSFERTECSVPTLPATGKELSDFVAEGWGLIDSVELDYNGDGITDYVGVQEAMTEEAERGGLSSGLRILFGIMSQGPDQYRLDFQDENLIPTAREGGPFGDPYESLTAEGTSFTTRAYGGSAWKWDETYTYTYRDGNWYLARSEELAWYIGPAYIIDWVIDDWERGIRTRCIQSDDREVMERRLEELEGREEEGEYDLVYEMRLDEPPTLCQAGKRGWLAPDRVTDWEVREIVFANGEELTPEGIDIVMPNEAYICYCDEDCILYTFSNGAQDDKRKYFMAMYRWQDKSLMLTEGDEYSYVGDPKRYRDKIYYSTEVTGYVNCGSAENEEDYIQEECRIGMRLNRIDLDGTGEETIFEYLCPGLEQQPLPERPSWLELRVRDISGGEVVVEVRTDGPDPVYRMNVDGSDLRQIGQIPRE